MDALDWVRRNVMEKKEDRREKNHFLSSSYLNKDRKIGMNRNDENVFGYWKNEANLPPTREPLNMLIFKRERNGTIDEIKPIRINPYEKRDKSSFPFIEFKTV